MPAFFLSLSNSKLYSTMSSLIRVGILGLGKGTGTMVPGLWAAQAHLTYLLASPQYEVVAVCNSSVQSAQDAIKFHKLGTDVKPYGSPEDIANDLNVDLIVVSVRVGMHYALTKPALLAGKDVFVEWPLGASTAEAEELSQLADAKGVKTVVGLQARASPLVVKIREMVQDGKIGKVLSSTVRGSFAGLPAGKWPAGAEYYLDIDSGGNALTIFFGHCNFPHYHNLQKAHLRFAVLDSFTHVLGPFSTLNSMLKTEYKTIDIIDTVTYDVTTPNHPKTSPDHVLVQGTLTSGAVASMAYYTAPGPKIDSVGIHWIITGSEGQIEIITPEGQWQLGASGTRLKVVVGKGEVEVVDLDGNDGEVVKSMVEIGKNTARVYEAFVSGVKEDKDRFADFRDAVETHKLLDWIRTEASS
jgi:predicted dehydrogenase